MVTRKGDSGIENITNVKLLQKVQVFRILLTSHVEMGEKFGCWYVWDCRTLTAIGSWGRGFAAILDHGFQGAVTKSVVVKLKVFETTW